MNMWAQVDDPQSWGYFKRQDIPYHYALADAYTVGDAYHVYCSNAPMCFQVINDLLRPVSLPTPIRIDGSGRFVLPLCQIHSFLIIRNRLNAHIYMQSGTINVPGGFQELGAGGVVLDDNQSNGKYSTNTLLILK